MIIYVIYLLPNFPQNPLREQLLKHLLVGLPVIVLLLLGASHGN